MRIFSATIMAILSSMWLGIALAAEPTVTMTWTYDYPPPDLKGFVIYINGDPAQEINDPAAREAQFICSQCVDGENSFVITAVDQAGQEGEPSDPVTYTWDAPPTGQPSITNIQITILRE